MRVLVVKLGAIGDLIMSLSIVSALRAQHPDAHLTWVVGRVSRPILDLVEGVDTVVMLDETKLFRGGMLARLREILAIWWRLAGSSFDLVITGHSDPRYRILTATVRAAVRRGFQREGRAGPLPGRLHSQEYVRLLSGQDGPDLPFVQPPRLVPGLPMPPFERGVISDKVVVLAPGGASNVMREDPLRRWPVRSYAALARILTSRGFKVVLVGGAHDRRALPEFADIPVIDLIGRTTLPELAVVCQQAQVVVTHDSLALHMAGLVRTGLVALFGPTSPSEKVPRVVQVEDDPERIRVIWGGANLPCRPCYDGRDFYECKHNRCMEEITVDAVLAAVEAVVAARR